MKHPTRDSIGSLKDMQPYFKGRDLDKEAAQRLWDEVFLHCQTHDPDVCEGIIKLGTHDFNRCAPCEKEHKQWREAKTYAAAVFHLS